MSVTWTSPQRPAEPAGPWIVFGVDVAAWDAGVAQPREHCVGHPRGSANVDVTFREIGEECAQVLSVEQTCAVLGAVVAERLDGDAERAAVRHARERERMRRPDAVRREEAPEEELSGRSFQPVE